MPQPVGPRRPEDPRRGEARRGEPSGTSLSGVPGADLSHIGPYPAGPVLSGSAASEKVRVGSGARGFGR